MPVRWPPNDLPGVIDAAVARRAARYAAANGYSGTIVDWPHQRPVDPRRAHRRRRAPGANLHVLSQASLTELTPEDDNGYPPPGRAVNTKRGPLRRVVSRSDIGGEPFARDLSALDFRQYVMAETTIRALSSTAEPVTVDRRTARTGIRARRQDVDLGPITQPDRRHSPQSLLDTSEATIPQPYDGPVAIVDERPGLDRRPGRPRSGTLRESGRVYVDLLTDGAEADRSYQRELAMSGSSTWEYQPARGEALVRGAARDYARQDRRRSP